MTPPLPRNGEHIGLEAPVSSCFLFLSHPGPHPDHTGGLTTNQSEYASTLVLPKRKLGGQGTSQGLPKKVLEGISLASQGSRDGPHHIGRWPMLMCGRAPVMLRWALCVLQTYIHCTCLHYINFHLVYTSLFLISWTIAVKKSSHPWNPQCISLQVCKNKPDFYIK